MTFPSTPWNWFQHPRLRNPGLGGPSLNLLTPLLVRLQTFALHHLWQSWKQWSPTQPRFRKTVPYTVIFVYVAWQFCYNLNTFYCPRRRFYIPRINSKQNDFTFGVSTLSPVATEGFVGLGHPKKLQAPPNWNMKHYKSVEFLSNFISSPLHKREAPPPH